MIIIAPRIFGQTDDVTPSHTAGLVGDPLAAIAPAVNHFSGVLEVIINLNHLVIQLTDAAICCQIWLWLLRVL